MTPEQACLEAKHKAGGPAALARALGIRSQGVSQWRVVPAKHVLKVEELTGVARHKMRPDFYPAEEAA